MLLLSHYQIGAVYSPWVLHATAMSVANQYNNYVLDAVLSYVSAVSLRNW